MFAFLSLEQDLSLRTENEGSFLNLRISLEGEAQRSSHCLMTQVDSESKHGRQAEKKHVYKRMC